MAKTKVWMRMGDNDDYHDFDDPFEAGSSLGAFLSETGTKTFKAGDARWRDHGVEAGGFTGYNYISLFWGDKDAQDAQGLNDSDKQQFIAGIRDGGYFSMRTSKSKYKTTSKPKSKKRNAGIPGISSVR
jgi:hypothetical protein